MIEMYVKLVREGKRTIDQVPIQFRTEVQAILNA